MQTIKRSIPVVTFAISLASAVTGWAAETDRDPWQSAEFIHRQRVKCQGRWGRLRWEDGLRSGVYISQANGHGLPHWSQSMEATRPVPIAVNAKIHSGFPWVIRAADGRLLLYYRVGRSHASDPATIVQRSSFDDGASWSEERVIHRDPDGFSGHNPVAAVARDGRVLLFVSSYDWRTPAKLPMYWSHSDDHGETWAPFAKFDTAPSRSTYYMTDVLSTANGLYAMSAGFAPDGMARAHNLLWHSPNGREWALRSFHTQPKENRGNEVALYESAPGRLSVLLRDRRMITTWRNESADGGQTWSDPEDIGDQVEILQRPFITRLTSKVLLLSGRDRKRRLVVVYVSRDNGGSFGERHVIDSYAVGGGYTAAVRTSDTEAVLVYYADTPTTQGKPDIKQVALKLHDHPKYVCFDMAAAGKTYYYSGDVRRDELEQRSYAWLQPPDEAKWHTATLSEERTTRGAIPLAPPPLWEGVYIGTARPVTPWGITSHGGTTHIRAEETTQALRIIDAGSVGNEMAYVSREWELRPGRIATVDLRLQVVSCTAPGGCMLRLSDGLHEEMLTFYPDRIVINGSGQSVAIDLTSGFVDMRITAGGNGYSVRKMTARGVGPMLIDGRGRFSSPAYQSRRTIDFGGGSGKGKGEALWKMVRYRITEER